MGFCKKQHFSGVEILDAEDTNVHLSTQIAGSRLALSGAAHDRAASSEAAGPDPGVGSGATHWVCVRYAPHQGPQAKHAIRLLGHEVHWPRLVVRRYRQDDVLQPLFPGYLFAALGAGQGWGGIVREAAVLDVLGAREFGRPTRLPLDFVEGLIRRAGAIDLPIDETPEGRPLMRPGPVTIHHGALDALKGLLMADKGEARVKVLMEVLGRQVAVHVPREKVRQ